MKTTKQQPTTEQEQDTLTLLHVSARLPRIEADLKRINEQLKQILTALEAKQPKG